MLNLTGIYRVETVDPMKRRALLTASGLIAAMTLGAAAVAVVAFLESHSATDGAKIGDPFRRPPTPSDRLPAWKPAGDQVLATRRIAVSAQSDRSASLYLARTRSHGLCIVLVAGHAAGGSCNSSVLGPPRALSVMYGLHYASGVVRGKVRRVVVTGTGGRRHRVHVSAEGGFIYRCPAFSGCQASVRSIEAYDRRGGLIDADALPGRS
jgi:hypothetical protein